ncbi:hypothetical protein N5079_33380 [Planotetraspora sp. A-T 1434]|uniref:hypothetical protein n=1 Tax=Planotetraspora sp. A-T 1434 TaxID=2979219 RepID=UPI0021BEDC56|nr:hypothetical protein [Planotetraspora sp. A-T 1434]MCT9935105.1 hypothetical protein [Planotetraspora sp. A-T 1434]
MSFGTYARRVRDRTLPYGSRYLALRSPTVPRLSNVLDGGEMLINVTIGMDVGTWSSVTVASPTDLQDQLDELSAAFEGRVTDYEKSVPAIRDIPGFLSAMRRLAALD